MKTLRIYTQELSLILLSLFLFSCTSNGYSLPLPPQQQAEEIEGNDINIALLLDTSSSMQGLIDQAKSQLWKIVNTLAMAKKNESNANLNIALYQYGNDLLNSREGYIQQILPLTNDLDAISEKLFALTTNGGEEYCGHVIQKATNQLNWNELNQGLNLIFIAGNEGFNQGKVNYSSSCKNALEKQITVNTIFCGNNNAGVNGYWKDGADLTGGNYMNIDMNQRTTYVTTPYDQQISALNDSLNTTYLSYGTRGKMKKLNQSNQDNNSTKYGVENKVSRAVSKSSHLYANANWDLVDASKEKSFEINKINEKTLPTEMKGMNEEEKLAYIKKMAEKRAKINKQIQDLNKLRLAYIASAQAEGSEKSLDFAMLNAIKKQAISKGFMFDESSITHPIEKAYVDFDYFQQLATQAKKHRATRLIDFKTFVNYSKDPNTIILDTRSKSMYDKLHLKGAIHLNFSDFTQATLANLISDTNKRILIYCNNNFKQTTEVQQLQQLQLSINRNMASKAYIPKKKQVTISQNTPINTMALNIPTYINLYGYHYRNVYELNELVAVNHPLLEFEGTDLPN